MRWHTQNSTTASAETTTSLEYRIGRIPTACDVGNGCTNHGHINLTSARQRCTQLDHNTNDGQVQSSSIGGEINSKSCIEQLHLGCQQRTVVMVHLCGTWHIHCSCLLGLQTSRLNLRRSKDDDSIKGIHSMFPELRKAAHVDSSPSAGYTATGLILRRASAAAFYKHHPCTIRTSK